MTNYRFSVAVASPEHSDEQIVKAINNGDKGAFEWLFFEYYADLCLLANQIVHCEETAKDVVQNIFLNLWRSREKWEVNTSLKAYIFSAVRNRAINKSKKQRNRDKLKRKYATEATHNFQTVESSDSQQHLIIKIWNAVDNMPERRKFVFTLHRKYGLTYKEIGDVMDISPKTVENHMGLALKQLRDEIKPENLEK